MNSEERLAKLFELARTAEPEMPLDVLEKHIKNSGTNTPIIKKLFNPKFIYIMVATTLIGAGLYYLFMLPPTGKIEVQNTANHLPLRIYQENKKIDSSNATLTVNSKQFTKEFAQFKGSPKYTQEFVAPQLVEISLIPDNLFKKSMVLEDTNFTHNAINISSIKLIELTPEELIPFGISVADKKIKVPMAGTINMFSYLHKKGSEFTFQIKNISDMGFTDSSWNALPQSKKSVKGKQQNLSPATFSKDNITTPGFVSIVFEDSSKNTQFIEAQFNEFPHYSLITDDLGQKWREYEIDDELSKEEKEDTNGREKYAKGNKESEQKLIEKLPGYIPILVRSGDVNLLGEIGYRADIIIWYEADERLFKALPSRIGNDLRKEFNAVFVNNNTSSQSCKYFEACQNHPGAIESLVVYPNPTDDELNVDFNLSASRIVNASIYSISGQPMKHLWVQKSCEKGANKFSCQLNEMLPGVYILVVETDKGDIISKRIVRR